MEEIRKTLCHHVLWSRKRPLPGCFRCAVLLSHYSVNTINFAIFHRAKKMDPNPALVQTAPSFKPGAAPLILIHDGGGTTFSYHCLKSLHRTVYAIHNPRFYSGRVWAGGITAMAKVYVEMIRSVLPLGGSLILGGKFPPLLQVDSVR